MKLLGLPSLSTRALGLHAPVSSREKLPSSLLSTENQEPATGQMGFPERKQAAAAWLSSGAVGPPVPTWSWNRSRRSVAPSRGSCHRRTLIGHYRNLSDVCPRKYTPVVCKIKCIGILSAENTLLGLILFCFRVGETGANPMYGLFRELAVFLVANLLRGSWMVNT